MIYMIVETMKSREHYRYLTEVSGQLRRYKMQLNLEKYALGFR